MDNLSHALAGLATGELIHRLLPAEKEAAKDQTRHRLLLVTAALAGNFPDLDLVLTPLLPQPLGYLLHHRGHTHTMLYALPQMLLLAIAILLAWPSARRLAAQSGVARAGFLLASLLGFGLHLAMDYLNSYGLHPFHPFDANWVYGDMVFILEPMFWVALGVPLAMLIPRFSWRVLWIAALLGVPLYFAMQGYLAWHGLLVLYAVALVTALSQLQSARRGFRGILAGVAMLGVFLVGQAAASRQAGYVVRAAMQSQTDTAAIVRDVALTAFPSHPFCWAFTAVESDETRDTYRFVRGVVSLLPNVAPAGACPRALNADVPVTALTQVAFIADVQGSLSTLRATRAKSCFFDAWLRFARMPWLDHGTAMDLRFENSQRRNFTTINTADFNSLPCPEYVPNWGYPRADLLQPPLEHLTTAQ